MRTVTRTVRWDSRTGWLLVLFSDHSWAGYQFNATRVSRASLVRVDATPLLRRHTLQDPKKSRLSELDLEPCYRNQALGMLPSPRVQIWFWCSPTCRQWISICWCAIQYTDSWYTHRARRGRLTSRGDLHRHHWLINKGAIWKPSTDVSQSR